MLTNGTASPAIRARLVMAGALLSVVQVGCSTPAVPPTTSAPTAPTAIATAGTTTAAMSTMATTPSSTEAPLGTAATTPVPRRIEALAVDDSGRVYGSDCFRNAVFRFDETGPSLVAGIGSAGFSGDGGPAEDAALNCPSGLVFVGGELYIVDDGNNRVRMVGSNGNITTVADSRPAGTSRGSPYEGGVQAAGIAIGRAGEIYIADRDNYVVRRIDREGVITTFAGNGQKTFGGDGGPAIEASLSVPIDVVIDELGNVYVSDLGNSRVRMIDPEGNIVTFAGTGERTVSGDGGPALEASFCDPTGLAVGADGSVYVAGDCGPNGHHVRRIDANGIITTIAGVGSGGSSGDGGPAVDAEISVPSGLALTVEGTLYIADVGNRCIRKVDSSGIITSLWCA